MDLYFRHIWGKSDKLDRFAPDSPGATLDKYIVEAMNNAPFMPAHKATLDPLMSSNIEVLDPNTTVRNVPTLEESNRAPKKNVSVIPATRGLARSCTV